MPAVLLVAPARWARYGAGIWLRDSSQRTGFPYATLFVNFAGCFAMGFCAGCWPSAQSSAKSFVALVVGVLGGFTSF